MASVSENSDSKTKLATGDGALSHDSNFIRKIILVALFAAILFVIWQGAEVLLLVFAGLLLGLGLRGAGNFLSRRTSLSESWSVTIVLIALAGAILLGWRLFAATFADQFGELSATLPQAIDGFGEKIGQRALAREMADAWSKFALSEKTLSNLPGRIAGVFSATLGIAIDALVVLATGIYFAFSPDSYYEGTLKLFPPQRRKRAGEIAGVLGSTLRRWLLGRIGVMAINGAATAIGLWLLGIPLAAPLGLLAGLFNFIPNIGPLVAAVPALLVALTISPAHAAYTAVLYLVVQNIDGFVLTPLVQQKTVALPAVVVIAAQLLFGILFGFLGVLLAVPLVAVLFVLVKMLYVEDVLGERAEIETESDKDEQKNHKTDF